MAKFNIDLTEIKWLQKQLRESVAPLTYQTNNKGMASLRLSKAFMEEHVGNCDHILVSYFKTQSVLCLKVADMDDPQEMMAARKITKKGTNSTGVVNFKIDSEFPQCIEKVGIQAADFEKYGDVILAELKAPEQPVS